MKRQIKLIIVIMALLCISIINNYNVYADQNYDDIIDGMSQTVKMPDTVDSGDSIVKVINTVIGIMQFIGTGIALIVVTICGIKYMLASAQEKAEIKKQLIPIVIGCLLLFAAVNIVGIIADTASDAGLTN